MTLKDNNTHFASPGEMRLPLPLCMESEHKSVFHYLFSALPHTQLRTLSLDKPGFYLTIADLVCLGDAIRRAPHLKTLDLQNLFRVSAIVNRMGVLCENRPALYFFLLYIFFCIENIYFFIPYQRYCLGYFVCATEFHCQL